MAALRAELGYRRHLASTIGTGARQRSAAFLAEPRPHNVLALALWAFHHKSWGESGRDAREVNAEGDWQQGIYAFPDGFETRSTRPGVIIQPF
jgi:hypothetical protein